MSNIFAANHLKLLILVAVVSMCLLSTAVSLTSYAYSKEELNAHLLNSADDSYGSDVYSDSFKPDFKTTPQNKNSVNTLSLQGRTDVDPITTSNRVPMIYGYVPYYCDDVAVMVFADTANLDTGEGIYAFFSEAGEIDLITDNTSEYEGYFRLDLQANGLGLINGKYNLFVSSKCGYASYGDPLYSDIYLDAISIIPSACTNACTPVHRFYNTSTGTHFYTSVEHEKRTVMNISQFKYEGIVNFAKIISEDAWIPVHRFYNLKTGTHFYTASQSEATRINNTMASTYRYEGPAYYASSAPVASTISVHRFYKFNQGVHFFTSNQSEATIVNNTMSSTYRYEGASYYNIANN